MWPPGRLLPTPVLDLKGQQVISLAPSETSCKFSAGRKKNIDYDENEAMLSHRMFIYFCEIIFFNDSNVHILHCTLY